MLRHFDGMEAPPGNADGVSIREGAVQACDVRARWERRRKNIPKFCGKKAVAQTHGAQKNTFEETGGKKLINNLIEYHVKSFIVDVLTPDAVECIPVIQLKEADLAMDGPVIIMSGMQNINPMCRKLKGQFPKLADITGCAPLEMPVCNQI